MEVYLLSVPLSRHRAIGTRRSLRPPSHDAPGVPDPTRQSYGTAQRTERPVADDNSMQRTDPR